MKRATTILGLFFLVTTLFANEPDEEVQKMLRAISTASDTAKVKLYADISHHYLYTKPDEAVRYGNKALELSLEIKYQSGIARSYVLLAKSYYIKDKYDTSIILYNKALDVFSALKDSVGISKVYQSVGSVHFDKGDFALATDYTMKAIRLKEGIGHDVGLAYALISLSEIQRKQGYHEDALKSLNKAYLLAEKEEDTKGMAACLNNSALIHNSLKEFDKSIEYREKALELYRSINDKIAEAKALEGMGIAYSNIGEKDEAIKYLTASKDINQEMDNTSALAVNYVNIGHIYLDSEDYEQSEMYFLKSLKQADQIGYMDLVHHCYSMLFQLHQTKGDYKKAFEYQSKYMFLKDSLFNETKSKQIQELQTQYETEKKEKEIRLQKAEINSKNEEVKRQNIQKMAFAGGFGLMLVLAFVVFRSYRQKKKANETITYQKELVEEKNKEITDSIKYAKRIQSAILPPDKLVKEYLQQSFILYKPKDIVAGDFYWMEHKKGKVLFAAADCTGHGVPGAMVSVVCNNGLNRSVREYDITDPGKILDKTREIVIQEFEKSEEEVKDGMDIAICSLEGNTLQYAGANNPLWIVRKGTTELEQVEEIKPDKQPIGKYADTTPFTTHTIQLNKGDSFYIFSDGYPDQFGGPNGKKLKYRPFRKMLLENVVKPMEEQRAILDNAFEKWKGNLEQIDDVCIIGVRV